MRHPTIIQGGMGAALSGWPLARAVAREGQLGVVSGTALDTVLARRLQDGDREGHVRRALAAFPDVAMAARVVDEWLVPGGRARGKRYRSLPRFEVPIPRVLQEMAVLANFVEVWLAREGHDGPVGINYLEKIQMPNLPSLYGAMLAGVDYVLMGAGIPRDIPPALDRLARHEPASMGLSVEGARPDEVWSITFSPSDVLSQAMAPLKRPTFLAIVASNTLAMTLARSTTGRPDGFVVEGPTAGGHNAPPRGALQLDATGQPVYGPRDAVDLARLAELGLPFWLAGSRGTAERLREALALGAAGIQVGTPFAFCAESGLAHHLRSRLLAMAARGAAAVFTDPLASPTGFPFKVARLEGTLSEAAVYQARRRLCDLGYLRRAYRRVDGTVGYRCPSEPVVEWVRKGGTVEETEGRKCLCNGLLANVGLAQPRRAGPEAPIVTAGDDLAALARFPERYTARDVIQSLLS